MASALRFWKGAIGLDNHHAGGEECLSVAPAHLLELRQEAVGKGARGRGRVRLGLTFPERWIPGVADVAADFGHKVLTPLVVLETAGHGRLRLLELRGPGDSVIRLMSEEDMAQVGQQSPT